MTTTREVLFQWRGLTVTGQYWPGEPDDGEAELFEVESISLGGEDLPLFLYEACQAGKDGDSLQDDGCIAGRQSE
jgi:hypothetical protein